MNAVARDAQLRGVRALDLDSLLAGAFRAAALHMPLDRSVAINPLLSLSELSFDQALTVAAARMGVDPWPTPAHLAAAGVDADESQVTPNTPPVRPMTMLERELGARSRRAQAARTLIGRILITACSGDPQQPLPLRLATALPRTLPRALSGRRRALTTAALATTLMETDSLSAALADLPDWTDGQLSDELTAHVARLPGWAAWANWCDWSGGDGHPTALSRKLLLALSVGIDLLVCRQHTVEPSPPQPLASAVDSAGAGRLTALERAVHGRIIDQLTPASDTPDQPELQVVTCIDVRSEPLRRALEADPGVQTFGFAGFFGVPVSIRRAGESVSYAALPVPLAPSVTATERAQRVPLDADRRQVTGALTAALHEPQTMFALAEIGAFAALPLAAARTAASVGRAGSGVGELPGPYDVDGANLVDHVESALRGMSLTGPFAPHVLLVGHGATSTANAHAAQLDCGACAGHRGGANASILADLLSRVEIRGELARRGIDIPAGTRFIAAEHDTATDQISVAGEIPVSLRQRLDRAREQVRAERAVALLTSARMVPWRAHDWSQVRPEWALAGNAAMIIGPRSATRGARLDGKTFLHSYDPDADPDGALLEGILAAPMVVAQWINSTYYLSSTCPDVYGAGDKTLASPVGDFAVIAGDDPDLRIGLPWQSVAAGDHPYHLPVRLLVAIDAPAERVRRAVHANPQVASLVGGQWVRLISRDTPDSPWQTWEQIAHADHDRQVQ
jgi:uncharacterized protein